MRKIFSCLFLLMLLSGILRADTFTFSFFQGMTDNLFQNKYSKADQISMLNFFLDKSFGRVSVFSEGSYSYLYQNSDLTYYLHNIGLDYLYPLSGRTALYFSLIGLGAFYRSEYDDFNHISLNFHAALKTYLNPTSIMKGNYSLEYKNYRYSLFDYVSHSFLISFDKYFQTKTTLKSEINWGYKFFLHPNFSVEGPVGNTNFYDHSGKGKGPYSGRRPYLFVSRGREEGETIQVLSFKGLIAQSVSDNVGLRVFVLKQWTLSGENPFSSVEEFYMVENPSYDRFSWAGYQLDAQIAMLIPWNIGLKMSYTVSNREFPGIEVMSLEGVLLGMTRKDKRKLFEAKVEKNFPEFSLFLSYFYIDNHSNDPYFAWQGHFFQAGVEWKFFFGGGK